jgi:UDP-N-acetylglucosamine--N-acetylmuramyl-(pentapeptide) pyrophosphoryl-undecaprenol N-acetylglucosamine transferase
MSGGGTAGHVYPALAVAGRLAEEHDAVLFVGTPSGLEARLVPQAGVAFEGLKASGYDRARPWTLITSTVRIAVSTVRALGLLARFKPDVVMGFGGYVSIPVGLAAGLRRTPLVVHEQNSVPGLANRFLSRFADAVGVTYGESTPRLAHGDRAEMTGNPVRPAVLDADRAAGREALGLPAESTVLLVFGGSRGARHLNSAVVGLRDRILGVQGVHVVHVTGRTEVETVREALSGLAADEQDRWRVYDYIDDMGGALAAADLVVARAGATSIAEITALGKAAVLVPYPYATDDHQTTNAAAMVAHGAAELVADSEIDGAHFGDLIVELLSDGPRRATMSDASRALGRPDAAEHLIDLARGVVSRASAPPSEETTEVPVA